MREFVLVANITFSLAALDAIQRRLRNVDMATIDELLHVAEEKRQQQRADVTAIDVRIGHKNYFVIAEFTGVEIVFADAGTQRGDDGANFFVAKHLVVARFFYVENFSFERKDGLEFAVAAHFCGAACGFALNDEKLAVRGITFLAVGELAGESA